MKNFTAKIITAITAAALLTCGLAACNAGNTKPSETSKQNESSQEVSETTTISEPSEPADASEPSDAQLEDPTIAPDVLSGGWQIPEDMSMNDDLMQIFDDATAPLKSYFYCPVMLLSYQVVAGTNYAFLCKDGIKSDSTSSEYIITYVYVDINGDVSFLGDEKIDLPGATGADVTGGWAYSMDADITPEIEDIMSKATTTLTGATYEPVAYIGSQVVAGTNYAILCTSSPSVAELDGETTYVLVYVYEDLDGNCEITDTVDITLGA